MLSMLVLGNGRFRTTYPSHPQGFKQIKKKPRIYISSCALDIQKKSKNTSCKLPFIFARF